MGTDAVHDVVEHLRRAALLRERAAEPDALLLGRFVEQRDAVAFEVLVQRHGPMVLGVCLRLLRHAQDAEDAFQATFLVLVRKAATVVPREAVANFLYGVARQTAIRARALNARRTGRERPVATVPEVAVTPDDDELRALLDEELDRLPARYRSAIVLCDLEGRSRKEAAQALGCPEGSLSSRLARGKALLARRLARRGVEVPTPAAVVVPAALVSTTARLAGVAGVASNEVVLLAEGVLRAMVWKTVTTVAVTLVALGALAGGVLAFARQGETKATGAAEPPTAKAADKRTPTDAEAIQGTWSVVRLDEVNRVPPKEELEGWKAGKFKIRITADTFTFLADGSEATYKLTLDPATDPRRITWTILGQSAPGIYSLKGDELKLCMGRKGDTDPPASFDVSKAAAGTFPTSWTLKRDKEGAVYTPEQLEKDAPKGEVTVKFEVADVGHLNGAIRVGEPPYRPISLATTKGLKDSRSRVAVILVGKALTHVYNLGIDPDKHFKGATIEATGKVRYTTLPRVSKPDGTTEVPANAIPFTHYEIILDSLDHLRVRR